VQIMSRHLFPVCLTACLLISTAQAQTLTPQSPSGAENPAPGDTSPGKDSVTAPPATSEQLSRSGGIIKPPDNVDRKIEAPTPNPGPQSMPIVPPPGSPGGNPDVKPK
jgi:hypothetical protein